LAVLRQLGKKNNWKWRVEEDSDYASAAAGCATVAKECWALQKL